jgi:hypothetical protein
MHANADADMTSTIVLLLPSISGEHQKTVKNTFFDVYYFCCIHHSSLLLFNVYMEYVCMQIEMKLDIKLA